MSVYIYTIYYFIRFCMPFSLWAYYRYFIASLAQCLSFLPDPTIEGDGQVFDQDQYVMTM